MNEYFDPISKEVLIQGITKVIGELAKRIYAKVFKNIDRKAISEALISIQIATIKTRNFIQETGYQKNEDLTVLWHDALNKVIAARIDDGLPDYLYQKAKFWGQPKNWLDHPSSLELVPKLNDLDEKCEMLLQRLK